MRNPFRRKPKPEEPVISKPEAPAEKRGGFYTADHLRGVDRSTLWQNIHALAFQRTQKDLKIAAVGHATGMDAQGSLNNTSSVYGFGAIGVPDAQAGWYASQTFIGYQMMALIAQHWLVDKAVTMPARDAVRNGYELTFNGGDVIDTDVIDKIRKADRRMRLKENMIQFVRMNRIFGVRVALFKIESPDPDYYLKPFNPDGVKAGSYKGIAQVDPYWITPELSGDAVNDPSNLHFYEPTYWVIQGKRYHRSHLIITTLGEVADVMKPTYYFGGVSIPQKIYNRVYCAERTADEAPQLAMTKRTNILATDATAALADEDKFTNNLANGLQYQDNFQRVIIDKETESMTQLDTALSDLDDLIMSQFQLVAAASGVPATKLIGTTPKGFNATGEYEESSYHEELQSIQECDIDPLLERHYLLLMRSEFNGMAEPVVVWNALDAQTAEEVATENKTKAETDKLLFDAGAIDGVDIRARIQADPKSGYNGIESEVLENGQSITDE